MAIERRVKAKVFLEGLEVPFFDFSVSSQIGQPVVAEIGLSPADSFFELTKEDPNKPGSFVRQRGVLPRTMVHIFYLDDTVEPNEYRLLFEGEYLGYRYEKAHDSRRVRAIAMDLSNVFNIVYTRYFAEFFLPYDNLVAAFAGVNRDGRQLSLSLTGTDRISEEILRIIRTEDAARGRGISAAFKRIVAESIGKNDFFRLNNDRVKLVQKVFALDDPNSHELIRLEALKPLLQQNLSNLKEANTLWDVLNHIMSIVFYYPLSIGAAPYIQSPATTETPFTVDGQTRQVTTNLLETRTFKETTTAEKSLVSLLFKPYTFFSAPPTCNVIFPDQYSNFTFSRRFDQEPTRLVLSAFSLIDEALGLEATRLAPRKFLFLAPTTLINKIDQEVQITQAVASSVIAAERAVEDQKALIASLERQKAEFEKNNNSQAAGTKATEISNAKTELDRLSEVATNLKAQRDQDLARSGRSTAVDAFGPEVRSKIGQDFYGKNILTSFDGVDEPSREDIKGIIARFDHLTNTQAMVAKSAKVPLKDVQVYLSNLANYRLYLAQHEARQAQVQMVFSPQLLPGFPAVVIDPIENIFGELDVVVHSVTAEGAATTQAQLSLARADEPYFSEISRNDPAAIGLPNWVNTKYHPKNISNSVYRVLFPKNGNVRALQSILAEGQTQFAAALAVRERYQRMKDKGRFIWGYTQRNVATIDQVFSVLGAVKLSESQYVMAGSTDERLAQVLKYRAQVQSRVFSFSGDFAVKAQG